MNYDRWNNYREYLLEKYGTSLYRVGVDGGFSCPNRTKEREGGCTFCDGTGSIAVYQRTSESAFRHDSSFDEEVSEEVLLRFQSIENQIKKGLEFIHRRYKAKLAALYFQSWTNTYDSTENLKRIYDLALSCGDFSQFIVSTRPDCVGEDVVSLLCEYSKRKPVWVELGLQTIHEDTAAYIRRGYDLTCFENALKRLNDAQIPVIVHVILGLPGEDKEKMLETIRYLNNAGIFGIKLQLLHVLENTDLADEFRAGKFQTLSMEAYVDLVVSCIGALSPDIVIHRLTGDGPSNQLISPLWSRAKRSVLNCIHQELKTRGI